MTLQLAIVSDQVLPTLIPALMEPPEHLILLCSKRMRQTGQGQRQKRVLQKHDVNAFLYETDFPDTSLGAIRDFALELAEWVEAHHAGQDLVLNATGGTKLMSLGLIEVFRDLAQGYGLRIIYTDTAHGRLEVLSDSARRSGFPDAIPMGNVLDVKKYLWAQGFRVQRSLASEEEWRETAQQRKQACKFLGTRAPDLEGLFGQLNWLAHQAHSENTHGVPSEADIRPVQLLPRPPRGPWAQALQHLERAGLIHWDGEKRIEFTSLDSIGFIKGGWLEEYVWHVVKDAGVNDCLIGVEGVWDGSEAARNEFDVLACHRNQLLFVECKTLSFGAKPNENRPNDNEIAYKLNSLGNEARGLFGETWLVTARTPTQILKDRARQARFEILGPPDLAKLKDRVQTWMGLH